MEKIIKKTTSESFYSDDVNAVPTTLVSKCVTEHNRQGIPTEEETCYWDEGATDSPSRTKREFDEKGRLSLEIDSEGCRTEYSYEETPVGNTIRREKTTRPDGSIYTEIFEYDAAGHEIESEAHMDENTGHHTKTVYDSEGRVVEIINDGGNRPEKTHDYFKYDRSEDGAEICEHKVVNEEGKLIMNCVETRSKEGNVTTVLTQNFDEDGNFKYEDKYVCEEIIGADGVRHLLHEDSWVDGKHNHETVYEYASDDFAAVTITDKWFDINCVSVEKTTVEYWD